MIPAKPAKAGDFSLTATRQIVQDCFRPKPLIYWTDFLVTYGLGIFCFQRVRGGNVFVPHQGFTGEWSQVFLFVACCLLFYRAGMFIHELIHQRNGRLGWFSFVWNLLCGVPFLMPTFVYYTHIDHHRRAHYGTDHDGEYLPIVAQRPWYILFYLSWTLVIPLFVVARFMLLTPIAWISPRARRLVHRHASSMVMDPSYLRPLPTSATMRTIKLQELACFLWCWGIAILPPILLGRYPTPFVVHAYLMSVFIIGLNSIRTLGSHRWRNRGDEMTFLDQLLDSVNYPSRPVLSEVWGPVGSRFHALHHLFPSMPYHEMPRAHRRLMAELPADSPYRQTVALSLASVVGNLWRECRSVAPAGSKQVGTIISQQ